MQKKILKALMPALIFGGSTLLMPTNSAIAAENFSMVADAATFGQLETFAVIDNLGESQIQKYDIWHKIGSHFDPRRRERERNQEERDRRERERERMERERRERERHRNPPPPPPPRPGRPGGPPPPGSGSPPPRHRSVVIDLPNIAAFSAVIVEDAQ